MYKENNNPLNGQQAKVVCSWQAVVMRLRITQGTEGYARIGKTTGLSGGCFLEL